jgi:hypothetical protein
MSGPTSYLLAQPQKRQPTADRTEQKTRMAAFGGPPFLIQSCDLRLADVDPLDGLLPSIAGMKQGIIHRERQDIYAHGFDLGV